MPVIQRNLVTSDGESEVARIESRALGDSRKLLENQLVPIIADIGSLKRGEGLHFFVEQYLFV